MAAKLKVLFDLNVIAVQMMAAAGAGAQDLTTRSVADYKLGPLPVLQPAELLALL